LQGKKRQTPPRSKRGRGNLGDLVKLPLHIFGQIVSVSP
jgi:hypothetical protein